MGISKLWLCFIFICDITAIFGNVYYLDPLNGKNSNSGSENDPWSSLHQVIEDNLIESKQWNEHPPKLTSRLTIKNSGAPIKSGDTLMLLTGYHGSITLMEYFNDYYITIMALPGQIPTISNISFIGGRYWRISGLTISPEFAEQYNKATLVRLESHNWRGPVTKCEVENCNLYSVSNSSNWTMAQWDTLSCSGISASGDDFIIRNNHLKNINFGITVSGNNSVVSSNIIENFAGDGMRGLGNDLLFEYNTVKNCYDVNANHDDGFQSWSINDDPPRERVTLRGNTIINYEDLNQPFRGTLQGIGCFDGPYKDWVIENNVVITDHWHGISLYGAYECRIINNTVVDINNDTPGPPWIGIFDNKDGTHSEDCVVRNNIATSFNIGEGCTADHNLKIKYIEYDNYFNDFMNFDLSLVEGCPAIDSGIISMTPYIDILKNVRPYGAGVDLGAYEYGSYPSPNPEEKTPIISELTFYPNPFSTIGYIHFKTKQVIKIKIELFDLVGRLICLLAEGIILPDSHNIEVNAAEIGLTSGSYICRVSCKGYSSSFIISHYK